MGNKFAQIAFTDTVRQVQQAEGSRPAYADWDIGPDTNQALGKQEIEFITQRDSFYMATVSETGWPYVQHRGGPVGFVQIINPASIRFADFSGNRQYVSVGNLKQDDRVSLFFMDYPGRTRLKLFGRASLLVEDENVLQNQLGQVGYRARVERGLVINVEAFDWNCPQHIAPRYTEAQIGELVEKRSGS